MKDSTAPNIKILSALFLLHFCGDFYSAFIGPLLPALAEKLSLNLTEVGFVRSVSLFLAFIIQPLVGLLADRFQTRIFLLGGPLLAALFMPLMGVAPSYAVLLFFVGLGSLGVAAFHPQAAGMVSTFAGKHVGLAMALFWVGGAASFGAGPILATSFVAGFGLHNLPFMAIFGVACLVPLYFMIPVPQKEKLDHSDFLGSIKEILGDVWRPIVLIYILIVFRSLITQSFTTFIPMLYAREGYSLVAIGWVVSLFTVMGSVSGLLAGHLADRMGYRLVFYVSYALSTPCLLLFLYLQGPWIYWGAALAGFVVMATYPVGVALAQEIAPKGKSLVSSMMMGLAFGMGGFLAPVVGKFSDMFGIKAVMFALALIPLVSIVLIHKLPEPHRGG